MASPLVDLIKELLLDILQGGGHNKPVLDAIAALDVKVTGMQKQVTSIQNFIGDPGTPSLPISAEDQAVLDQAAVRDQQTAEQLTNLATEAGQISTNPPI